MIGRIQNSPLFGANIIKTEYLEAGIARAKEISRGDTFCSVERAEEFEKALEFLKNDGTNDEIIIQAKPGSVYEPGKPRPLEILRNGKVEYTNPGGNIDFNFYDDDQCMLDVTRYVLLIRDGIKSVFRGI